jgi:hypothetical protein
MVPDRGIPLDFTIAAPLHRNHNDHRIDENGRWSSHG